MKHKPIRDLDRFGSLLSPSITKADLGLLPVFARHDSFFDSFEKTSQPCGNGTGTGGLAS